MRLVRLFSEHVGDYVSFDLGLAIDVVKYFVRTHHFLGDSVMTEPADEDEEEKIKSTMLVDEISDLLRTVIGRYPSNDEACALLAKLKYELKQVGASELILRSHLARCPNSTLATVVKAQNQLSVNNTAAAEQSLQQALSQDFSIQQHALYCLVKGSLQCRQEEFAAARDSLNTVLNHVTNKTTSTQEIISQQDRLSCFINLAEALKSLKLDGELSNLLSLADETFTNLQAFQSLKFKSDLYLDSGNAMKALAVYDDVSKVSLWTHLYHSYAYRKFEDANTYNPWTIFHRNRFIMRWHRSQKQKSISTTSTIRKSTSNAIAI